MVDEMKAVGIIRLSKSPFSSIVVLVKKRDGTWRFSVNYHSLNQLVVKDKYHILLIDDLLDDLHGSHYFSELHLRAGFHHVHMVPEDIPKTVFRMH